MDFEKSVSIENKVILHVKKVWMFKELGFFIYKRTNL